MRFVREIKSGWLFFYFGVYLSILMGGYMMFAITSNYVPFYVRGLFVVSLAILTFLLVCTIHEMGHSFALRLRNYVIFSIRVWLYLLPVGVNHPRWRSQKDATMLCLSGPFAGLVASLVLGYILLLSVPNTLLLTMAMIISAIALGILDYKEWLTR